MRKAMDFGNILDDPRRCKEIALRHWNEGRLTDGTQLRAPKVGESWPGAFMPYWRQAIRNRQPTTETRFNAWATIHDRPFWNALVKHIADDAIVGRGLTWAGMHGNMAAFGAASEAALETYAANTFVPTNTFASRPGTQQRIARLASAQKKIVHPDVVVFMRDKGYWNQTHISELVEAFSVDDPDGASILRIDPLSRGLMGFEPSFYHDWFSKAMGLLHWSADEQARFVGHLLTHVDACMGLHRMVASTAGVHSELDLGMLMLSVGAKPAWAIRHSVSPEIESIHATIHTVATAMREGLPWNPSTTSHSGVALHMDLMPPQSFMELYRLGCACKERVHNTVATPEILTLPAM